MNEKHRVLKEKAYKIISEEGLPKPTEIKFIRRLGGVKRILATVTRNKKTNKYKILIHTHRSKFLKDVNGKYKDKNGSSYCKSINGEVIEFPLIIWNMAHEIAHLRFWNHSKDHKFFNKYLFGLLIANLESSGIDSENKIYNIENIGG